MKRESEDKAERVLSLYTRLKQGKVIYKEKESQNYQVSVRTIQRDIADIQSFLQNQNTDTGEQHEIVFDKHSGGYILQTKCKSQLEGKEILGIVKVMLESRALIKKELFPIIYKLVRMCSDDTESCWLMELFRDEMHCYVEQPGSLFLDELWEQEMSVRRNV